MNSKLRAIKAAMDDLDFDKARKLADAYVKANPDVFQKFDGLELDEVVRLSEKARDVDHDEEAHYTAEAFHLYTWPAQNIGGPPTPEKRVH